MKMSNETASLFAALPAPDPEPARVTPAPAVPYTWSEAHRHACEVRYVRGLSDTRRAEFLAGVEQKRGAEAARRLRGDL